MNLRLFAAALAANLAAQTPQWLESSPAPRARTYPAMANDPRSGQPLLFSGFGRASFLGNQLYSSDLWQWSGGAWVRCGATGPAPRHGAGMALDLLRSRVVLFGGSTASGYRLADTWEYDGSDWIQCAPVQSPPGSWGHGMAYDPLRQRTVLFGGFTDTWEWDGNNWSHSQPVTTPPLRYNTQMVFDFRVGGILMYGGVEPSRRALLFDDTWIYDGVTWTQLSAGNPPARMLPAMAFSPARGRTVLFGGTDGLTDLTDTWEFGPTGWLQTTPGPAMLAGAAMAYDWARGVLLLHGTELLPGGAEAAATWNWNGTNWTKETTPATPPQRSLHGFVADAQPDSLLLFGGSSGDFHLLADTWRLHDGRWRQLQPATAPPARCWPQMACDRARNRVVLFGGEALTATLSDTWEWDGVNWTQRFTAISPPGRSRAGMAGDAARGHIVLFGGSDHFTLFGDTWTFDGSNWRLAASGGPSPRTDPAMTWDSSNQRVLLFGGIEATTTPLQDDLWSWGGTNWTQLQPATRPQARGYHCMAFDPLRRVAVVHGGQVANVHGNTWEWSGAAWSQTWTASAPDHMPMGGGTSFTMSWDEQQQCLVLFDGLDLWHYTRTPASSSVYGSGCGGSRGPLQLAAAGRPYLGNEAFHCELRAAAGGQPALLMLALASATVPLGGGCQLLLAAPQPWLFGSTPAGRDTAMLAAPLPLRASLIGLQVRAQAGVLDNSLPLGFALSNGLLLQLGH